MAQQGKAGKALAIAAWSSFAGGTLSAIYLLFLAAHAQRAHGPGVFFSPISCLFLFLLLFLSLLFLYTMSSWPDRFFETP